MLEEPRLLHDLLLLEDVGVLLEEDHGQAAGGRCDDRVHYDVVRTVVVVDVDDFFSGTAIHKQTRYENDERAGYKKGDVLRVERPLYALLVKAEDAQHLLSGEVLELRVLLPEPVDVALLHTPRLYSLVFVGGDVRTLVAAVARLR